MSPPDADEGGTRNYNKRIDYGILHHGSPLLRPRLAAQFRIGAAGTLLACGSSPVFITGYLLTIHTQYPLHQSHIRVMPAFGSSHCIIALQQSIHKTASSHERMPGHRVPTQRNSSNLSGFTQSPRLLQPEGNHIVSRRHRKVLMSADPIRHRRSMHSRRQRRHP
jgi:hypothetical protein